ncbi:hypothetical protein HMSSN036_19430 [Paenibacillus macerans]|nr:hypothetical protein HMSSN036_19430 [Paenibacillus macerans]
MNGAELALHFARHAAVQRSDQRRAAGPDPLDAAGGYDVLGVNDVVTLYV